ncbi:MAG: catechol 2,3-dioxygenase-like lactoylglutathione lyase family enzyme [Kiritimatiellia bacterium]|jgi:lactoylglutathione lyase
MKIKDLNHVALLVADLDASCHFYGTILGLSTKARPAFDFPGAWFALGPVSELHLIAGREAGVASHSRGSHIAFEVEGVEAARAQLEAAGVDFVGPKARPDGAQQIFVVDPDGYYVELSDLSGLA